MNNKNRYVKKIRDIFKTVPGRGLMLNLEEDKLKMN